jgi:hypothetical protein
MIYVAVFLTLRAAKIQKNPNGGFISRWDL